MAREHSKPRAELINYLVALGYRIKEAPRYTYATMPGVDDRRYRISQSHATKQVKAAGDWINMGNVVISKALANIAEREAARAAQAGSPGQ